ncbi:hypothetical protein ACNTMW_00220 [Planosporangium sp. 12N6]|uniref:hypothetical protein n=1 Tax=Planosporangium spinosum TaxID=3402278 RepID=UPI003CEB66A3
MPGPVGGVGAVPGPVPRPDWRDHLRDATDVALVGFAVTVAALPVLTAPAAVAAGSAALAYRLDRDRLPTARQAGGWFVRALLPGVAACGVAAVAALLVALDVAAVRTGRVPGGAPVLVATALAAAAGVGVAALTVVAVGRTRCRGWWAALRGAVATTAARPAAPAAAAGTVALAALLAWLLPATTPLVVGFGLFGLHVVARRLA